MKTYRLHVPLVVRDAVVAAKANCDMIGGGDVTCRAKDLSKLLAGILEIFDADLYPISSDSEPAASGAKGET